MNALGRQIGQLTCQIEEVVKRKLNTLLSPELMILKVCLFVFLLLRELHVRRTDQELTRTLRRGAGL